MDGESMHVLVVEMDVDEQQRDLFLARPRAADIAWRGTRRAHVRFGLGFLRLCEL